MELAGKIAVVTGAGSGIGRATALELAQRGVLALGLVDRSESAVEETLGLVQDLKGNTARAVPFVGDVTDERFRRRVFDTMTLDGDVPRICVPAAGITRDALAVKLDKTTGRSQLYSLDDFRLVMEVNLVAPIYWAMEMVGRIAELRHAQGLKRWSALQRVQGAIVLIGSVSSQGIKGQISYATTKAGLEGAAATLMKEAIFYGVRCSVIHPGFTDTPMVHALGNEYIEQRILPETQLGRLIRPGEIADAICFMLSNSAVSGELWADGGFRPPV
jgi:NAD(P)-dependent dehydrogenase (short-subunit alcohol dehydrogenase family)